MLRSKYTNIVSKIDNQCDCADIHEDESAFIPIRINYNERYKFDNGDESLKFLFYCG